MKPMCTERNSLIWTATCTFSSGKIPTSQMQGFVFLVFFFSLSDKTSRHKSPHSQYKKKTTHLLLMSSLSHHIQIRSAVHFCTAISE